MSDVTRPGAGPVIGVVGGSGGVGASMFAAVLAVRAAAVLIDLDVTGGGIDVLLGLETEPGARWSGLHLAGGHLEPEALRAGLPRAGPCAVLAADVGELDPEAVGQVLGAAAALGPVVLDLPRAAVVERAAALLRCDLVVVLARADVAGLVSAHVLVDALPELPLGIVLRRADVDVTRAAQCLDVPCLGVLPPRAAVGRRFEMSRLPRATVRVADGVLAGATGRAWPAGQAPPARRALVLA
ncbi:hypothetical protein [uncultured Jatrophihabitans sp.]|uniref:hypothetical protein n=1 Tax=uncultured Jatrophihabitans sp. TaxID=1610747 RepID=UPI0035C9DC11